LNLITGVAGQFCLGHAGFYGMGAYIAALIATRAVGIPYLLELLLSAIGAGLFAVVVAYSCIRVSGDYLAIITLASAEMFRLTCTNWESLTNGPMGIIGIPYPRILSVAINNNVKIYYLGLVYFFISLYLCNLILHSKYGRAFKAIREDEIVALSMGVPVFKYKVLVFFIGAFFAGIAGNYVAHLIMFISPDNFTTNTSIYLINSIILGGIGTISGSFIGAGLMLFLTEFLRFAPAAWRMVVMAIAIIVVMIKMPQGIAGSELDYKKWFNKIIK